MVLFLKLSVRVCVNTSCKTGPYMDRELVQVMPPEFGPSAVSRVLRNCVQSLVDAASDKSAVYGMLRQGKGKVHISGMYFHVSLIKIPLNFVFYFIGEKCLKIIYLFSLYSSFGNKTCYTSFTRYYNRIRFMVILGNFDWRNAMLFQFLIKETYRLWTVCFL